MNKNMSEAPFKRDIILFRKDGRPPIIAGMYSCGWETFEGYRVDPETITGWAFIPDYQ